MIFRRFFYLMMIVFSSAFADEIIPIAVIGSGPAGLSAAFVTAKEKVDTYLFQGYRLGGPLNAQTCLSNWPASVEGKGKDAMQRLLEQAKRVGVHFSEESIVDIDFSKRPFLLTTSSKNQYYARTVILATGAIPKTLGLKGEQEYWNKGIETFVYKTDAERFLGKKVAIVGGGIDAVKKARIISKWADEVYLIVRGKALQKQSWEKKLSAKGEKIKVFYSAEVQKISGNEEHLTKITVVTPNDLFELPVDHLVLALGIVPNTEQFKKQIPCDASGYILLKARTQETFIPGVFAAGTVSDAHYRQAAISSGDGMKAGYDALESLKNSD